MWYTVKKGISFHIYLSVTVELNMQKQAQLDKEREELIRTTEEIKMLDMEEKRRYVTKELLQVSYNGPLLKFVAFNLCPCL